MSFKDRHEYFDFLSAAAFGYKSAWANRMTLLRLLGLPIAIKLGCIAAIIFLGFQDNVLRHGLIMLPAYFAEGFLICYIIRTLYNGADLAQDVKQARNYYNDIIAGMIAYVLVQIALAILIGVTLANVPLDAAAQSAEPPSGRVVVAALSLFFFMVWGFRFAWLYLPMAMGIKLSSFLTKIQSFRSSFPMLGCWLAVFIPLATAMMILSQILYGIVAPAQGADNTLAVLVLSSFQGAAELVINIVCAIAMSYGFKSLMENK